MGNLSIHRGDIQIKKDLEATDFGCILNGDLSGESMANNPLLMHITKTLKSTVLKWL